MFSFVQNPVLRVCSLMMLSALTFSMLGGCQQQEPDYIEVKRVHEQLTKSEVRDYLKIIYSLPTRKVPPFPSAYAKPAEWEPTRTLSVHDLVLEEEKYIENIWNEEVLVRQLSRNKPLMKRLKRARMTPQQFIGFTRTIGMAMSRGSLRENQNLREILEEGERVVQRLKEDKRSFSALSENNEEDMHVVLQNAMWLTRVDRIERLLKVPPENVDIVRKYASRLEAVFPDDFKVNPLDEVQDLLVEYGLPFEETELVGSDVNLAWEKNEARVGHDPIDGATGTNKLHEELIRVKEILDKQ
ncbi:MAG: hypothetical protein KDA65_01860 [Planctomycetaceae bacterium]|nr:hypothetical protein [Planctomycetaceae bacterium]